MERSDDSAGDIDLSAWRSDIESSWGAKMPQDMFLFVEFMRGLKKDELIGGRIENAGLVGFLEDILNLELHDILPNLLESIEQNDHTIASHLNLSCVTDKFYLAYAWSDSFLNACGGSSTTYHVFDKKSQSIVGLANYDRDNYINGSDVLEACGNLLEEMEWRCRCCMEDFEEGVFDDLPEKVGNLELIMRFYELLSEYRTKVSQDINSCGLPNGYFQDYGRDWLHAQVCNAS